MQNGPFPPIKQSALQTHRAQQHFPYLGRDTLDRQRAIFTITDTLNQLGQASRTSTLLRWLGRFDGMEAHLEEDQDPLLCVRALLMAAVAARVSRSTANESPDDAWERMVSSIMRLDFVHTHSSWGIHTKSRIKWDPMGQTWLEFLEEGMPGESLTTWLPGSGNPDLARRSAAALLTGFF